MARIGHVPEIVQVKALLETMKQQGILLRWELPYENILTRLSAAIFFIDVGEGSAMESIAQTLGHLPNLRYRENHERKLSRLGWRLEFSADEEKAEAPR